MKANVLLLCVLSLLSLFVFDVSRASEAVSDPQVGIQLWSVKDEVKADIRGTLAQLKDMGFAGMEWAGEFGEFAGQPAELKRYMDSLGLASSAAHVLFDALSPDKIDDTIEFYKTLGVDVLIVPWDERAFELATVQQTIDDLNRLAPILEKQGMVLGYHNHDKEFVTQEGTTTWDRIAEKTPTSMILQLDVAWATVAGKNAADYIRRYGDRTATTHFKAAVVGDPSTGVIPIIGTDSIDWGDLINAIYTQGETDWIILEQEQYPADLTPMQSVRLSKLALDGLLLEHAPQRQQLTAASKSTVVGSAVVSESNAKRDEFEWGTLLSYFAGPIASTEDVLTAVAHIKPGMQIHPPHQHEEEEFLMVLNGVGTWSLNGETFAATAGDILYAKPNDFHGLKNTGDETLSFIVFKWGN